MVLLDVVVAVRVVMMVVVVVVVEVEVVVSQPLLLHCPVQRPLLLLLLWPSHCLANPLAPGWS
ncbi:MAG: hypothetical protein ACT6T3_22265 [Agrobacterium sp.]|uniref:hypothetical protein n=1 Tax=Agrobacterium sp. TaxID=361 RepID=UPI004034D5AE